MRIPDGSLLKPKFPAALSGRTHALGRIFDVMGGVLGQGAPDAMNAAGFSDSPHLFFSGYKKNGEWFQLFQIGFGGIPGRPIGDGPDGHSLWPGFTNVPNEFIEAYFPLRIVKYEPIADSGGAGLHRGGNGLSVGEVDVMGQVQILERIHRSRRVLAGKVSQHSEDLRLVQGIPELDTVPKRPAHDSGVVAQPSRDVPVGPSSQILKGLGQVPVVERYEGLDARFEQGVGEPGVEVQALRIHLSLAQGQDPWPGDGEAVSPEPELAHQRDIFPVLVIVIAGDVSGSLVFDLSRSVGEAIPDGLPLAVLLPGALDLIRRSRRAPEEVPRKRDPGHRLPRLPARQDLRIRLDAEAARERVELLVI